MLDLIKKVRAAASSDLTMALHEKTRFVVVEVCGILVKACRRPGSVIAKAYRAASMDRRSASDLGNCDVPDPAMLAGE
jgi:hypothetical protein